MYFTFLDNFWQKIFRFDKLCTCLMSTAQMITEIRYVFT
jgi:hypothetical protein